MITQSIKVACSNCNLRELCMPLGLSEEELQRLDDLVATRRKIARGDSLYRNGDKFSALYAIRTGFFKTTVAVEDGRDQVTGFQMAGEVIGLDGIVSEYHTCILISRRRTSRHALAKNGPHEKSNTGKVITQAAQRSKLTISGVMSPSPAM